MFDELHLTRPATGGWPSRSFNVTAVADIWWAIYDFLLVLHLKYISILHCFPDINTYLPKRRHVTLTTPTWGTVCHHKTNTSRVNPCTIFDDSIFSHSREIQGGVKFWNGSRDQGHAPFSDGRSRRRKANTWYGLQAHKIWQSYSFSRSRDISGVYAILECVTWPRPLSWSSQSLYFSWPNCAQNLKFVALAVPKIFHGL